LCYYTTRKGFDAASVTITHRSIDMGYNIKYVSLPLASKTLPIQSKDLRKIFNSEQELGGFWNHPTGVEPGGSATSSVGFWAHSLNWWVQSSDLSNPST